MLLARNLNLPLFSMDAALSFSAGDVITLKSKEAIEIVKRIGRGAEGCVYLCKIAAADGEEPSNQHVAVKFMPARAAVATDAAARADELAELALSGKLGERYARLTLWAWLFRSPLCSRFVGVSTLCQWVCASFSLTI